MTNKIFAKSNEIFKTACSLAGVIATVRQASKYRIAIRTKIFKGMASRFIIQAIQKIKEPIQKDE